MGFVEAVKTCFRKYFDFSGRASRSEFWWFTLFNSVVNLLCVVAEGLLFGLMGEVYGPISGIYTLATLIPNITVNTRRLQDLNHSGWWQLLPIVSLLLLMAISVMEFRGEQMMGRAAIVTGVLLLVNVVLAWQFLVWWLTKGTSADNRFGSDPLANLEG